MEPLLAFALWLGDTSLFPGVKINIFAPPEISPTVRRAIKMSLCYSSNL